VGIGTSSPADKLEIHKAVTGAYSGGVIDGGLRIDTGYSAATGSYGHNGITFYGDADNASFIYQIHNNNSTSQLAIGTNNTERMRIDSSGNLLLGTNTGNGLKLDFSPSTSQQNGINYVSSSPYSYTDIYGCGTAGTWQGLIRFFTSNNSTATEAMRIDSSGNLLVGTTDNSTATQGVKIRADADAIAAVADGGISAFFGRLNSDGEIVRFRRDGSTVGSIAARVSSLCVNYSSRAGLSGSTGYDAILPGNGSGGIIDNFIDLGISGYRFDDIYATNGTIQTSDANEKQQIAPLTDAEMTAAKAISQLFKTFKWNSAVETKGDAARTHAGVIAQDVQAAMTAAGLDAGDYAFFISSTWWETQTEVPAVEAVEAVYEDVIIPSVLDADGNEVEAERTEQRTVTEAVEAVAAYTRTDTYETAEEAPEGAVERTRLGIRYPELLAFVGAATEQRLANIETRLTALEIA